MIKYALVCNKGHDFESWFADSATYDKQVKKKLVACPMCDSTKVEKAIMAPRISPSRKKAAREIEVPREMPAAPPAATAAAPAPIAMMSPMEKEFHSKLKELRDHMLKNADNVGERFPEEARKMHYGEIEHRSIYGEASPDEAKKMLDEGIEFVPIPVLPEDRN